MRHPMDHNEKIKLKENVQWIPINFCLTVLRLIESRLDGVGIINKDVVTMFHKSSKAYASILNEKISNKKLVYPITKKKVIPNPPSSVSPLTSSDGRAPLSSERFWNLSRHQQLSKKRDAIVQGDNVIALWLFFRIVHQNR